MPSPGQIARRVLGPLFEPIGKVYRRVFVDLGKIVDFLDRHLPHGARVLDIGGGDGAVIDRLLDRRPDLKITMCDVAPEIGAFLTDDNRARVRILPATEFIDIAGPFDFVTICDVIHHVPVEGRDSFFGSLAESCERWRCRNVIFKDVEPGTIRGTLSLLADRYITGDMHVVLFSRSDFTKMAQRHFPHARKESAVPDWPNYGEVLSW